LGTGGKTGGNFVQEHSGGRTTEEKGNGLRVTFPESMTEDDKKRRSFDLEKFQPLTKESADG